MDHKKIADILKANWASHDAFRLTRGYYRYPTIEKFAQDCLSCPKKLDYMTWVKVQSLVEEIAPSFSSWCHIYYGGGVGTQADITKILVLLSSKKEVTSLEEYM